MNIRAQNVSASYICLLHWIARKRYSISHILFCLLHIKFVFLKHFIGTIAKPRICCACWIVLSLCWKLTYKLFHISEFMSGGTKFLQYSGTFFPQDILLHLRSECSPFLRTLPNFTTVGDKIMSRLQKPWALKIHYCRYQIWPLGHYWKKITLIHAM